MTESTELHTLVTLTFYHLKLAVITRPEMEIGRYHWMYRSSRPHRYHHVPALRGNVSPLGIQGK